MKAIPFFLLGASFLFFLGCNFQTERPSTAQTVSIESNGEVYTFQIIDSMVWGSDDAMHTYYSVQVNQQSEDAMKKFTDNLPITRSVRVFFFTTAAPLLDFAKGKQNEALEYIKTRNPIATTFKLNMGNKVVLYYEGFRGMD